MDTKPKQPDEPTPQDGISPMVDDQVDTGIPPGAQDAEPVGLPSSDRHQTEVTPTKE
jgi:hypothetical protein